MATEKVRATPEAAEALRKRIEDGEREGFKDIEEYRATSAAVIADDRVHALKFGAVIEDSRTA